MDFPKENKLLKIEIEKHKSTISILEKHIYELLSGEQEKIDSHTPPLTDTNVKFIEESNNVWYMNARGHGFKCWEKLVENNFVYTWNHNNRNKLEERLHVNDIIAWYMVGKGYISVLMVTAPVTIMTETDIDDMSLEEGDTKSWLYDMDNKDYTLLKIPVKFIARNDKYKCITKNDFQHWKSDWTSGLRGSSCMRPSNPLWKQQVIDLYNHMTIKDGS